MPRDWCQGTRTTRRTFLGSVGLAVAGLGATARSTATHATAAVDGEFVLEQGDQCIPLTPLSRTTPVEQLYQWGVNENDYSATGLVSLERADTTIMFLYDGPNGLSLVIVHDEYGSDTAGGSATMSFSGLPLDGEWVVQDDLYDGDSNFDQWTRDGDAATVDWTWGAGRTDGGVFRGLAGLPDLAVQITPAFNAAATLYGEYYDGEITDWQVLSGSLDAPDRTSLALDEPVVLRRGTCSTDGSDGSDGSDGDGGDGSNDDGDGTDGSDSDDGGDSGSDDGSDDGSGDDTSDGDSGDDGQDGDDDEDSDEYEEDDEDEEDEEDDDDDEDDDGDDDDDDDDDDEWEDEDDDHPGEGKGHEKGRGRGHEKGKGEGHEKHGHDDEEEDEEDEDDDEDDDHPGRGRGRGKGKRGRRGRDDDDEDDD